MAKPIVRTPVLEGAEAERFIKLHSEKALSGRDEEILRSSVATYRKYKKQ